MALPSRFLLRAVVSSALLAGCSDAPSPVSQSAGGGGSARPSAGADFAYAGMYEAKGVTSVDGSDIEREISGKIVLNDEGEGYSSTFSLSTRISTEGGVVSADLNGHGSGVRDGGGISGTAETQMILGAAPGLDPKFGFLPGRFGPRIRSTWTAVPEGEDRLRLEIATVGAPGEEYQSTTTTMAAVRTSGPTALKATTASAAAP